jgi:hypothetical protein
VVLLFVCSAVLIAVGTFVAHDLRPTGSMFGIPGRLSFPLCGRSYLLSNSGEWSKADVEKSLMPDETGVILEPTVGQIPLLGLLTTCPRYKGEFTPTGIWLHIGTDEYLAYSLEGGP